MPTEATAHPPLNEVQLMLLRLFSRKMTKAEINAVKKLLLEFYEKELQDELESVIAEKKISRRDFDDILNKQQRGR